MEEAPMRHRSRVEFKPVFEHVERRALLSAGPVAAGKAHPLEAISTQIGVGRPTGPFLVNATTPKELNIYVFGEGTGKHAFRPLKDISRKQIVINGVTFKDVKVRPGPVDESRHGIRDAIITVSPRSALNLSPGATSLTISGLIQPGTPLAHERWSATAPITVTAKAAQQYQAFVQVTIPPEGPAAQSIFVIITPGGVRGPFTIYKGINSPFQTDLSTNPTGFNFAFSAYRSGAYATAIPAGGYSLTRSSAPLYYLTVYTLNNINYVTLRPA
jgi:hypothetical protein